jgi:hypothetical protein
VGCRDALFLGRVVDLAEDDVELVALLRGFVRRKDTLSLAVARPVGATKKSRAAGTDERRREYEERVRRAEEDVGRSAPSCAGGRGRLVERGG